MAEIKATNITWHEGHATREERAALSDVERRLLAARYLLGLESGGEPAP